ncbi:hypothetical protein MKW94_021972 [Papaver nudicaule]|uniref:DNA repair RAD52-like protein 1, mitochondrial n=1 Tax=Papaver nudicaule TaxID=74823 RepID=A0AA42AZZ4_PAPNU|nr:hypothetical protein [Papaver nudicaule]
MASSLMKSLLKTSSSSTLSSSLRSVISVSSRSYSKVSAKEERVPVFESDVSDDTQNSGISKPLSEILKELSKKVPDSLIKTRTEKGFTMKYIPWHIVNRILNLHAPEWSGEVRDVKYSADGKYVSVVYRVTLYGTDAKIYRESTGTASVDDKISGDPVQKAESMAFRRACARLGLGLHLYHDDLS